ncbi:hypothetical protein BDR07DRAFT_977055 [Suillus spraguei]|nr:hypothetical protein BDR07DRAFT_977055 [Suillus spraguei]
MGQISLIRSDFESFDDLDQRFYSSHCVIPGLPPEHNTIVVNLLFDFATWHTYADLHTTTRQMSTLRARMP